MPKADFLLYILISFLIGNFIGSFQVEPGRYFLFTILFLIGILFLLPKRYLFSTLVILPVLMASFYWTQHQLTQTIIHESETYRGEVELLSLDTNKPPQQRALLKLLNGEHKNKRLRATTYDWTYETGTHLDVSMTIEPSQFTSDRGTGVIGRGNEIAILRTIQLPNKIWQLRHHISDRLAQTLPEPYASLATGLLTGAGNGFDATFKTQLQTSGTSHLVAVSGYNMTIVALMVSRFGNRFGRHTGIFISFITILGYYLLTGMSPAVARGALFTAILLWVRFLGRPVAMTRIVLLTACLMVFFWPLGMVYSLSWQLSFLAFSGILIIGPLLLPRMIKFFGSSIGTALAETLGAQIPVLPLITYTFGTVSLISPLTNIVVLSLTPYAMFITALQAVGAIIAIPIGNILAWVSYPILWLIVSIIEASSRVPFAAIRIESFSPVWCLAIYALLLAIGGFIWYRTGKLYVTTR